MKFVLDVKEWRIDCLMFGRGWDSLREKWVVTDCKRVGGFFRLLRTKRNVFIGCWILSHAACGY